MFPYEAADPFVAVLTFGYGLSFVVLAVGVWLHRRTMGSTSVGKGLPFLGLYAISHGLSEWGEVFIPMQARVLEHEVVHFLQAIHVVSLAASFWMLWLYGVELIAARVGRRWRWLSVPPTVVLLVVVFWSGYWLSLESEFIHYWGLAALEAWSRHLLAFPGALVAALGLYLQRSAPSRHQGAVAVMDRYVGLMAVLFLGYAVVGGLIVPQCPLLPGSVIHTGAIQSSLGIPVQVLRVIYGFGLTILVLRLLSELDRDRHHRLRQAEEHAAVLVERERIGRDLHDGVIQTLYGVSLQLEGNAKRLERDQHPAGPHVRGAIRALHETMQDIRGYVLNLRPVNPAAADLRSVLQALVEEFRLNCMVEPRLILPPAGAEQGLTQGAIIQLYYMVRELLTNVAKHARANRVDVELRRQGRELLLRVEDDGVGLTPEAALADPSKQGLHSLSSRLQLLGGRLQIGRSQPHGTRVLLSLPLEPRLASGAREG